VGIGTASPAQKLNVSGSGSVYGLITNTGTGPSNLFLGAGNGQTQVISRDATTGAVPTVFLQGTTESMRILSTGNILSLSGGSTTATGTGIAFPATQSASSDANTLDDYEEGVIDGNNLGLAYGVPGTSSFTYSSRVGTYTKIGRVVYFTVDIRLLTFSKGTASGSLSVFGLPFAQRSTSGFDNPRCTVQLYDWEYTTSPIVAAVQSSSTNIIITRMVSNNVSVDIDDPKASSIIWVTGFYFV
jgi:hypothetical protein